MFNNLRESWFVSKVETVIDTRLMSLPPVMKIGIAGLAHAIVMHQHRENSFTFAVVDRKRLDPRIAALHCIMTFMTTYNRSGQIIVNNEDCYETLKIISHGLINEMQTFLVHRVDMCFIELHTASMMQQHLPELFKG